MSDEEIGTARGVVSSVLLVAAVAAILLAGMVLRTDGSAENPGRLEAETSPAAQLPLGRSVAPEVAPPSAIAEAPPAAEKPALVESPAVVEATLPPAPKAPAAAVAADPLLVALATRAERDLGRLSKARGRWTAQLLVACKPETVDRLLETAKGSTKLYVLPAKVREDACFRVCFGDYGTSKDAAAAADLPKALRGKDRIAAAEIAKVLP